MPFLDYDVEIRKIICSTNAIESLNARYRRAVRVRGDLPNEQAHSSVSVLVRAPGQGGNGQNWTSGAAVLRSGKRMMRLFWAVATKA